MVTLNKKGMDISLNFVILAVLALIALIVVALFFTGGLTNLFKKTEDVGSIEGESIALLRAKCEYYCGIDDYQSWKDPRFSDEYVKAGFTSCDNDDLKSGHSWSKDSKGNDKCS